MKLAFWTLFAIWAGVEVGLFIAANNSQGQAMPIAPLLFWAGMVGGLIFFLFFHILIRKYWSR